MKETAAAGCNSAEEDGSGGLQRCGRRQRGDRRGSGDRELGATDAEKLFTQFIVRFVL
ncbi:hypothetical protein PR003_g19562 [Phytophthora rubi]|uniref:Uncharacterized protein n=1 Tax=Phytophthora rubi TaxID=129364 RepID=A0A6A4DUT0_9STRA|nr:hypothetical protein PR003_g19562 [Phytophthora rubi]